MHGKRRRHEDFKKIKELEMLKCIVFDGELQPLEVLCVVLFQ